LVKLRHPVDDQAAFFEGLVEVTFDQWDSRYQPGDPLRKELPKLDIADAGRIVVTEDNEAVGIIVGGSGYRALVAPLPQFLAKKKLTLGLFGVKSASRGHFKEHPEIGNPLYDAVAREPQQNYGDIPGLPADLEDA
jgi:hypothetical protein